MSTSKFEKGQTGDKHLEGTTPGVVDTIQKEVIYFDEGIPFYLSDTPGKALGRTFSALIAKLKRSLPTSFFVETFLSIYGFDGYDPISHTCSTAMEGVKEYRPEKLPVSLVLASLLGFPSRPYSRSGLGFLTFLRGFFGGWSPLTRVFDQKVWTRLDYWQRYAILIKFPFIFALKLVTWPFKLLINIIKLVTEVLPTILEYLLVNAFISLFELTTKAAENQKTGKAVALGIITGFVSFFWLSSLVIKVFGRMLSSPEKSARIAFHFMQTLTEKTFGKNLSYFMGGVFALQSVLISAVLWAIAFPLIINFAVSQFPIILEAVNWVMQLPALGPFLSVLKDVFIAVGSATSNFLSVKIASMISYSLGVNISNTILFLGTGIAYLLAPVSVILTNLTDRFSNWWALSGGSREDLIWDTVQKFQRSFVFRENDKTPGKAHGNSYEQSLDSKAVPLDRYSAPSPTTTSTSTGTSVTRRSKELVEDKHTVDDALLGSSDFAEDAAGRVESEPSALGSHRESLIEPPASSGRSDTNRTGWTW